MGPHHRRIDTGGHPLVRGIPPAWANGSGQDAHGVFVEVEIGEAMLRMRWCPPGRFLMGSPEDEPGRFDVEGPQVEITFRDGFWLMDAPVTQALWQAVMGKNPSRFVSPDRPVEKVSWHDACAFCAAANARVPGLGLHLPSEAAWEYACRAGTVTATPAGAMVIEGERNAPVLDAIAWYGG
ncbi:MAG: formylglycine-generating enzyme family protein, partial [Pseudomonadota bacterium]